MKQTFLIFLLSAISSWAFPQNQKPDSLLSLIAASAPDTHRVNLLRKAGEIQLRKDSAVAMAYYRQSVALARELNYYAGLSEGYSRMAIVHYYNDAYDSVRAYVDTSLYYLRKTGNPIELAKAYIGSANIHLSINNYQLALNDCLTAENYTRETGDQETLAQIFQLQSHIYRSQNQFTPALEFQLKAINLFRQLQKRPEEGHALYAHAMLLSRMKKRAEAHKVLNTAITIADSLKNYASMATYRQVLIEILTEEKRYTEARSTAQKALKFAELSDTPRIKGYVLESLSLLEQAQQNYNETIRYALQAYPVFEHTRDLWHQRKLAEILSQAYEKTGDTGQALLYHKTYTALHDSLLRQQLNMETRRMQVQSRFREKDNEIKLLAQEKELQEQRLFRQTLVSLLTGTLTLLLLGGIILLRNRSRLKHQIRELELRNRIASDLHDEVGSSLSSIHLLSQMIRNQPESTKRSELFETMSRNVKETVDRVTDIVWVVKPEENEKGNLRERMERFAYDICISAGIELELDISDIKKDTLTMEQRKNLYLIFKEAVNNAVKYSGTPKLRVQLTHTGKDILLNVEDHGRGFDPATVKKGNGLTNIRNRAKELNARLEISSREGEGTTVSLAVSLNG